MEDRRFFKPKEVGLGGTGWQGAERWPRLVAGDLSPPIRLRSRSASEEAPEAVRGDRWSSARGKSKHLLQFCIIMTRSVQILLSFGHRGHLQLHYPLDFVTTEEGKLHFSCLEKGIRSNPLCSAAVRITGSLLRETVVQACRLESARLLQQGLRTRGVR